MSSMIRLRMFMGMTSALLGVGGFIFDHGVGVSYLVERDGPWGWLWTAQLVFGGVLMMWTTVRELAGGKRRGCRTFSAFVMVVTWMAVGWESMRDGADFITLLAPVYVIFTIWAAVGEAHTARTTILREGT